MTVPALFLTSSVLVLGAHAAFAQDLSRYRAYTLESSLESVIAASGARATDAKTLHARPATIQELEWRAPYVSAGQEAADPVRQVAFSFFNDALYSIIVSYDRERTDGLTTEDMIESVSSTYGVPARKPTKSLTAALPDTVVLAQWEDAAASLTLLRRGYSPDFQLALISKSLDARARTAIREALRLDAIDAPRRELEQSTKKAADASLAREKARTTNKAAFRP